MWLARLFGGRKGKESVRPARIAPRIAKSPAPPVKRPLSAGDADFELGILAETNHGFDPYNSGSFRRDHDWERAYRR